MSEEKEKKSEFSLANVGYMLLIVLAGGLFVGQTPFHESRPDSMQKTWEHQEKLEDVDARLWQDPFEAIHRHKSYKQIQINNTNGSVTLNVSDSNKHEDEQHNYKNFAKRMIETTRDSDELVFVAVMLPGGAYYEDSETRRRIRYAVLSGFNASVDFQPDDSEHIGFYNPENLVTDIAYELVAKPHLIYDTKKHQAIILYISDNQFKEKVYKNFIELFTPIFNTCIKHKKKCQINLIAPTTSDSLRELAREKNIPRILPGYWHNFRVYSPRAGIDENKLLSSTNQSPAPVNNASLAELFKEMNLQFTRIRATDKDLAKALAEELAIRKLVIGLPSYFNNKKNHVVLISEKESLYGWNIADTYADELQRKNCKDIDSEPCKKLKLNQYIHYFSYFRGLDGEKPRRPLTAADSEHSAGVSQKNSTEKEAQAKAMENADGDSQFDYVRRLASKLEYLENQLRKEDGKISAIGILGSDVYDKLLVLEAMHEKFPQLLFFTNGMDARFLHPEQNTWARNLIVASSFDLELEKPWQRDIPPFRDSNQTAYFLATEVALWDSFHFPLNRCLPKPLCDFSEKLPYAWSDFTPIVSDSLMSSMGFGLVQENFIGTSLWEPICKKFCLNNINKQRFFGKTTIHEIGRTMAFDLDSGIKHTTESVSTNEELANNSDVLKIPSPYFADIHPRTSSVLPPDGRLLALGLIVIFFLYLVFLFFSNKLATNNGLKIKCETIKIQQKLSLSILVLGFAAAAISVLGVRYNWCGFSFPDEPFAWFEGVSIWPSEMIRYLAIIVATNGIYEAYKWPEVMRERLVNKLGFDNQYVKTQFIFNYLPIPPEVFGIKKILTKHEFIQNIYIKKSIFLKIAFLLPFSFFLISNFGEINIPFRGELAYNINITLMVILLFSFIFSFVMITGRTQIIIDYINTKQQDIEEAKVNWPIEPRNRYAALFRISPSELHDWVTIRLVGELTTEVNRLILYPMIVAALHVLSRMSYFDNWVSPPGLLFALGLSFAYLFYSDYRLKTVAEEAEKSAQKNLRRRLICSYADGNPVLTAQLKKLVATSESYAELAYKPFLQRPVFQGMMLVIAAAAIGYSDYTTLMLRIFR